jgi:hypothetical protein
MLGTDGWYTGLVGGSVDAVYNIADAIKFKIPD